MAFGITKVNQHPAYSNLKEFICQSEADISKLPTSTTYGIQADVGDESINDPCAIGSTAIIPNPLMMYVLSPDNTWQKVEEGGSA